MFNSEIEIWAYYSLKIINRVWFYYILEFSIKQTNIFMNEYTNNFTNFLWSIFVFYLNKTILSINYLNKKYKNL